MSDTTREAAEAAAFRRLVAHLQKRNDVQNIDMMNLAGFCRNCLADWLREALAERGVALSKEDARTEVYGMKQEAWKAKHQRDASAEQKAKFDAVMKGKG